MTLGMWPVLFALALVGLAGCSELPDYSDSDLLDALARFNVTQERVKSLIPAMNFSALDSYNDQFWEIKSSFDETNITNINITTSRLNGLIDAYDMGPPSTQLLAARARLEANRARLMAFVPSMSPSAMENAEEQLESMSEDMMSSHNSYNVTLLNITNSRLERWMDTHDTSQNTPSSQACNSLSPTPPNNFWGSYINENITYEQSHFNRFARYNHSMGVPLVFRSCFLNGAQVYNIMNRYYVHAVNPNVRLYSFWCGDQMEHIHLEADITKFAKEGIRGVKRTLKAFGIRNAGGYIEDTVEDLSYSDAKEKIMPIFHDVLKQMKNLTTQCHDMRLDTVLELQEKDENDLHYWRFPMSCLGGYQMFYAEVYQDHENCFVGGGEKRVAYMGNMVMNNKWAAYKRANGIE